MLLLLCLLLQIPDTRFTITAKGLHFPKVEEDKDFPFLTYKKLRVKAFEEVSGKVKERDIRVIENGNTRKSESKSGAQI